MHGGIFDRFEVKYQQVWCDLHLWLYFQFLGQMKNGSFIQNGLCVELGSLKSWNGLCFISFGCYGEDLAKLRLSADAISDILAIFFIFTKNQSLFYKWGYNGNSVVWNIGVGRGLSVLHAMWRTRPRLDLALTRFVIFVDFGGDFHGERKHQFLSLAHVF